MGAIKTGWDFFQDQILGMHWLKNRKSACKGRNGGE